MDKIQYRQDRSDEIEFFFATKNAWRFPHSLIRLSQVLTTSRYSLKTCTTYRVFDSLGTWGRLLVLQNCMVQFQHIPDRCSFPKYKSLKSPVQRDKIGNPDGFCKRLFIFSIESILRLNSLLRPKHKIWRSADGSVARPPRPQPRWSPFRIQMNREARCRPRPQAGRLLCV